MAFERIPLVSRVGGFRREFNVKVASMQFFNVFSLPWEWGPRSVSNMCFSILVLRLYFAMVCCTCVLQMCFALVCCECVLQLFCKHVVQLCFVIVVCDCVLPMCFAVVATAVEQEVQEVLTDAKAQEVLTDEKPKKS